MTFMKISGKARVAVATIAATLALSSPAFAGPCGDQIKALQAKAAGSDAAAKPGAQTNSTSPGTNAREGGGEPSASAKVLEAQAHDQRGDEAACMKALEEAKATIK